MGTPINVLINDISILDSISSVSITQQECSFCNSVTVDFKGKKFWALCDPTSYFGIARLQVIIGTDSYDFLIEERDSNTSKAGVDFSIWGRSKQALLSAPYSITINDTELTNHPWQTGNTYVHSIVDYIVSN